MGKPSLVYNLRGLTILRALLDTLTEESPPGTLKELVVKAGEKLPEEYRSQKTQRDMRYIVDIYLSADDMIDLHGVGLTSNGFGGGKK